MFLFVVFVVFPFVFCGGDNRSSLTLGLILPWEQGWTVGGYLASAIIVGLEEVESRQLLPDYQVNWTFRDDYCEPKRGEVNM